jgi:hypothetical protein
MMPLVLTVIGENTQSLEILHVPGLCLSRPHCQRWSYSHKGDDFGPCTQTKASGERGLQDITRVVILACLPATSKGQKFLYRTERDAGYHGVPTELYQKESQKRGAQSRDPSEPSVTNLRPTGKNTKGKISKSSGSGFLSSH